MDRSASASQQPSRTAPAPGLVARALAWGIVRTLIGVLAAGILICYAVLELR
jgi:hypothetical protein